MKVPRDVDTDELIKIASQPSAMSGISIIQ